MWRGQQLQLLARISGGIAIDAKRSAGGVRNQVDDADPRFEFDCEISLLSRLELDRSRGQFVADLEQ
jgi:hypothetical protein